MSSRAFDPVGPHLCGGGRPLQGHRYLDTFGVQRVDRGDYSFGISSSLGGGKGSSVQNSAAFSVPERPGGQGSRTGGSGIPSVERGYRGGARSGVSGFLREVVCGPQGFGDMETCPRLVNFEQVPACGEIHHGDSGLSERGFAARRLGHEGVRLRAYLDDWLILHQDQVLCSRHTQRVLSLAFQLGFTVNRVKSELDPSQDFSYLGMQFNTLDWSVRPSQKRVDKLQASIRSLYGENLSTARELYSLLGQMESMAPLVPLGRVHKRPFQAALQALWDQTSQDWNAQIELGSWFSRTTSVWLLPWVSQGVPIVPPPPQNNLFTDASLSGWGAHLADQTASGVWNVSQTSWHINVLELEAVALGLRAFLPLLEDSHVKVHTDNMTVAAYLNRQGGTRSQVLSDSACRLLTWCSLHNILLSVVYLKGTLNVLADALSRGNKILHSEWTLSHQALERLWAQVSKPPIDLFATRYSTRLPLFVSPFPDPQAWGVNALEMDWTNLQAYAFPPFCLLGKVIRKAELEGPALVLVAPLWPSQHWYPDLVRMAVRPPIPLGVRKGDLLQPRSGIPHQNPQALQLHGWILSEALCSGRVPQLRL
ncbi:uncharacterized protein [Littorina saxatilis]|uniref:uncharacterized protein n=1 Tax=Littorina saxatilis TaxID=31220 RepID=UPI0038B521AF